MMWWMIALASAPLRPEAEASLMQSVRESVEDTEALGRAATSVFNTLPSRLPSECVDEVAGAVQLTLAFTAPWDASAQDVKVLAEALKDAESSPTLKPLRGPEKQEELEQLLARAQRAVATQAGAKRTIERFTRRYADRCVAEPPLSHGIPRTGKPAANDPPEIRAVQVRREGWLCGATPIEVNPGVVLLERGVTCWTETRSCECIPVPVHAGAVL